MVCSSFMSINVIKEILAMVYNVLNIFLTDAFIKQSYFFGMIFEIFLILGFYLYSIYYPSIYYPSIYIFNPDVRFIVTIRHIKFFFLFTHNTNVLLA